MEILDGEDERPVRRESRDEATERPADLLGSQRAAQADERPDSGRRLLVDQPPHFARASSMESSSWIAAAARTISATGQNVIPSPYERQRPFR
jgi:hypothetical protein